MSGNDGPSSAAQPYSFLPMHFMTVSTVAAAWQSSVAPLSHNLRICTHYWRAKRACCSDPLRPIMPNASARDGTPRRGMPYRSMLLLTGCPGTAG